MRSYSKAWRTEAIAKKCSWRRLRAMCSRSRLEPILENACLAWLMAGLSALVLPVAAQSIYSEAYTFTTLAGGPGFGYHDGVGSFARFWSPYAIAVDAQGNAYIADTVNAVIRKLTPAGEVSTISGYAASPGSVDGTNAAARLSDNARGIAVDSAGTLYVADSGNNTIRKLARRGTNWVMTTIAGQAGTAGSADGTGTNATFYFPESIAADSAGTLYVADSFNNTIRKIVPLGTNWATSTIAGLPGHEGSANGTGSAARFAHPQGIAVDRAMNVYVADSDSGAIRRIALVGTNWLTSTLNAQFQDPTGLAVDGAGVLYVADGGYNTIARMIGAGTNWAAATIAGLPGAQGGADGTGTNATFDCPQGIAVDSTGNLLVVDRVNSTIRQVTSAGVVSTLAGGIGSNQSADGTGAAARFCAPSGIAVDSEGNLYVADYFNCTIRKVTSAGVVSTIAGLAGHSGSVDGVGSFARFNGAHGVAVDRGGNVYVSDTDNANIRQITPAGVVSTIAGSVGGGFYRDGVGTNAWFFRPDFIAVDSGTNLYVTESGNSTIRKLAQVNGNWVVSTIAGSNGRRGSTDGIGTNATFDWPEGIAVDSAGNLYVADGNSTIRTIRPVGTNWVTSTIAGSPGTQGSTDGTGTNASFYFPQGIGVDSEGNLYVADCLNNRIRKVSAVGTNWVTSTIGGSAQKAGGIDGTGSAAVFADPEGIAVDGVGSVYVTDGAYSAIRKGVFTQYAPANPVRFTQPTNNATLVVTLLPPEAHGQWRFPWELAWRQSGTAAANLVPNGNYPVEFSPVPGYLATAYSVTNYVAGGTTSFVTNQYYPTITSVDLSIGGSLEVLFQINAPSGAGWRLLGDTNAFHPSGFTTNLPPGDYLIECAALSNFVHIPILSVQISAGVPTVVQDIYQPSQPPPAGFLLPAPVPSGEITDLTNYPYGFNGQLETDVGYGSGVAVEANVVLTAAHLVFNDQTLSYVNQAWWYPQEEAPQFVPQPQAAQGWLVFSGYASRRTNDLQSGFYTADQSSPQSRNFDVAALYFQAPVANGGYGGYLPSDATPNTWLSSTAEKMLVGYPVDGSMFEVPGVVPGQMYEIGPQPYPLSLAMDPVNGQQVYTASWFLGYPGNSGGPFYVQFNGYYYPAGVYLGTLFSGTVPYASAVRALDSDVVNLITNAQAIVTSGTNNSGGGVITIRAGQGISANPGIVEVIIAPPAAFASGGAWKFSTLSDADYSTQNPSALAVTSSVPVQLQFKPIAGWNLPANQSVSVAAGSVANLTATYTLAQPQIQITKQSGSSFTFTWSAAVSQMYEIQSTTDLARSNWATLGSALRATNATMTIAEPIGTNAQQFYRVVLLP